MASRSSGMPAVGVYLVKPLVRASMAACLMKSGVSKSGSPAAKLTTSTPWATSALAFALRASVGDGLMALSRFARFMIDLGKERENGGDNGGGHPALLLRVLGAQGLEDPGGHQPLHVSAEQRHLAHQVRRHVEIILA